VIACAKAGKRSTVGHFLGGVSYPLYLNHWIGVFAANGLSHLLDLTEPVHIALAYLLAVLVGCCAYVAIDRNIMRIRKNRYSARAGLILTGTAYALLLTGIAVHFLLLNALPNGH
jgi:peptidoglycan/LPS O-acetylase OafA/YrhL